MKSFTLEANQFVCLFGDFCPTREFFTHIKTPGAYRWFDGSISRNLFSIMGETWNPIRRMVFKLLKPEAVQYVFQSVLTHIERSHANHINVPYKTVGLAVVSIDVQVTGDRLQIFTYVWHTYTKKLPIFKIEYLSSYNLSFRVVVLCLHDIPSRLSHIPTIKALKNIISVNYTFLCTSVNREWFDQLIL